MAHAAEDLSYEDLQRTVDLMVCKAVTSPAVLHLRAGIFAPMTLPLKGDESFG